MSVDTALCLLRSIYNTFRANTRHRAAVSVPGYLVLDASLPTLLTMMYPGMSYLCCCSAEQQGVSTIIRVFARWRVIRVHEKKEVYAE